MRNVAIPLVTLICVGCASPATEAFDERTETGLRYSSAAPEIGKIVDRNGKYCSGTLVRSEVVLTAAHCVKQLSMPLVFNIYSDDGASAWFYPVEHGVAHPEYVAETDYIHDVGLMKLVLAVPESVAYPRSMAKESTPDGVKMSIWGYSSTLEEGYEIWMKHYAEFTWPDKTSLVWEGDSGGPVIRGDSGQIVRVVSGILRNAYVAIDLSAPLSANDPWLEQTLSDLSNDEPTPSN
jgi:V8-like Glu-specific endopeptidase